MWHRVILFVEDETNPSNWAWDLMLVGSDAVLVNSKPMPSWFDPREKTALVKASSEANPTTIVSTVQLSVGGTDGASKPEANGHGQTALSIVPRPVHHEKPPGMRRQKKSRWWGHGWGD